MNMIITFLLFFTLVAMQLAVPPCVTLWEVDIARRRREADVARQ